jgi:hypothetical protein
MMKSINDYLPGIIVIVILLSGLVIYGRARHRIISTVESNAKHIPAQTKLWESQLTAIDRQTEILRRQADAMERIAVALESKKEQGHSG